MSDNSNFQLVNIEASPGSLPSHRFSGHSLWQPPHMCQTLFSRQCPDPFLDLKSFDKVGATCENRFLPGLFLPKVPQLPETVPSWFKFPNLSLCFSHPRISMSTFQVIFLSNLHQYGGGRHSDKKWVTTDENAIKCPSFKSRQSRLGPGWNDPIYRCDLFLPPTVTMEISRPPHRPLASPEILLGSWCSSLFKWPHTLHISTTCREWILRQPTT